MITYLYIKSNNMITSIIHDIISIDNYDIIGQNGSAKGNDFNILGYITLSTPLLKTEGDSTIADPIYKEFGNAINLLGLVDLSERILIETELRSLDSIVTRPQENYINFLISGYSYTPYTTELNAMNRKNALRLRLSEL